MINLDTFAKQCGNSVFADSLQSLIEKSFERYDEFSFLSRFLMAAFFYHKLTNDEFNVLHDELSSIYFLR